MNVLAYVSITLRHDIYVQKDVKVELMNYLLSLHPNLVRISEYANDTENGRTTHFDTNYFPSEGGEDFGEDTKKRILEILPPCTISDLTIGFCPFDDLHYATHGWSTEDDQEHMQVWEEKGA